VVAIGEGVDVVVAPVVFDVVVAKSAVICNYSCNISERSGVASCNAGIAYWHDGVFLLVTLLLLA
jgi:hypothetical protein